ncbi:peptide ABC transporter substrate-binding protein [Marinicella sp. W31]|uniref:peptide ABC transporter substrate-binding protein n=1 Tax=Marinicella sp. W31 TaxID=3023713 RepID=UPI00375835DE
MNKLLLSLLLTLWLLQVASASVLNRGNGSEPDSLNVHLAQGLNSHQILRDVYEGLMTLDAQGKPVYGVAEKYHISADGSRWTFDLRRNARWSDGSTVVAADFVRSWQQAILPQTAAPFSGIFDNIRKKDNPNELNVIAQGSHQLVIGLHTADAGLLEKLTLPIFMPIPDSRESEPSEMISNGAYKISQWVPQEKIVLQKNHTFHQADSVFFSEVVYWVTEEQSSELKRFRAGELDITETIPDNHIDWLRANMKDELHIHPYQGVFFLGLNNQSSPLDNVLFRQALSAAIDRNILVEKVLKTNQIPALNLIPPNMYDQHLPWPREMSADPEKAKALLQKSGVNAFDLELELLYNSSENQRKVALAVAAMWRQNLGIRARLRNQEWKVFVSARRSPERQVFRSGWIADYSDPLTFLELLQSDGLFNFYRYQDNTYDQWINQARFMQDPVKRAALMDLAEKKLFDQMPVIPLYFYVSRHLVADDILGYVDNISDRHLSRYLSRKSEQKKTGD